MQDISNFGCYNCKPLSENLFQVFIHGPSSANVHIFIRTCFTENHKSNNWILIAPGGVETRNSSELKNLLKNIYQQVIF